MTLKTSPTFIRVLAIGYSQHGERKGDPMFDPAVPIESLNQYEYQVSTTLILLALRKTPQAPFLMIKYLFPHPVQRPLRKSFRLW
tara:strand:+ start:146 stop:400 length:255 start_codon:yes stop_codon:yes gene_type:complete